MSDWLIKASRIRDESWRSGCLRTRGGLGVWLWERVGGIDYTEYRIEV